MSRTPTVVPRGDLPERVTIWEVGPRDGLQNEPTSLPTATKVEFVERLASCGLPVVEATSFVRPDRVPQLADASRVMAAIRRRSDVRYPVLVPNRTGLDRAIESGAADVAVFASATESFARRNINRALVDQMQMFGPTISTATGRGMAVRGYVSMCFGDPWEGAVPVDQVVGVCRELADAGCEAISLGDTIGVATAGQVRVVVGAVADAIGLDRVGVHFHDTYGQALANALAALEVGVTTIDSSAGGLGGCPYAESATGNLATEDVVWLLDGLGIETGIDVGALAATSRWLAGKLGRPSPSRVVRALGP